MSDRWNGTEIAIIGMAGRFPGAPDIDAFWRNIRDGIESITFFTDQELEAQGIDPSILRDPHFVKAAARLDGMDLFDAAFFDMTPREATLTDPQHRIFLECTWQALEHAGYDPETYQGLIGVFGGATINTYLLFHLATHPEITNSVDQLQINIANGGDFLTTRVSYKLNLKGPSHLVQSACSTSLVAVHIACQSLLNEECDIALAGGVSINVNQRAGYRYVEGGMVSPDGRCRAFDAGAQGTIFGSGVGVVVLRRLQDALAAGDCIHAVIRGSAVNNDGSLKVGYTAPSVDGQAEVIIEALSNAQVPAETITYVEAHGTGTPLGDPIEVQALTKAFRTATEQKGFCAIGSVKTNIGHLDAAAGVTSLIKTVLALTHQQLPPSLHFERPNPHIAFTNTPFYVNSTLAEWRGNGVPRRAGISSFGVGGTNAHVIIEEAPAARPVGSSRPWQLLVLSAKTSTALEAISADLAQYLQHQPDVHLADVAYTLQVGRQAFRHRRVLVCQDHDHAVRELAAGAGETSIASEAADRPIVFMFPGQGTQYAGMTGDLYQNEPTFRALVDRCATLLKSHLGLDLREVLYPSPRTKDQEPGTGTSEGVLGSQFALLSLDQTWLTQPALFVMAYALARLWMSWGIRPHALIGHSIGEYVAACLAGVLSLEDALVLVAARGRLMQTLPAGAMLAVPLSAEELQPLQGDRLSLAAINGPARCVVSGPVDAVEALDQLLSAEGINCRRLLTSHAFHSAMTDSILDAFAEQVQKVQLRPPQIPYVSNVTGTWITPLEATSPRYWARHLRQTVYFDAGIRTILQKPAQILLEVGPGRTLSQLARQHTARAREHRVVASLDRRDAWPSEQACLLAALGQLWLAGVQPDWSGFYAHERRRRCPLPGYPFERHSYWITPAQPRPAAESQVAPAATVRDPADYLYLPSWKHSLAPRPRAGQELVGQPRCWLVFADAAGLGTGLVQQLETTGQDVITVRVGQRFAQIGLMLYVLNPAQSDEYATLLRAIKAQSKTPQTIVHLWSITPADQMSGDSERSIQLRDAGYYSLLFLAQALEREKVTTAVQIEIVSNNMLGLPLEAVCPEKAMLLGPCTVIPQEYPYISCRCVDIVVPAPQTLQERRLVEWIIADADLPSPAVVVAYRGAERWVPSFEPVRLEQAAAPNEGLRENGVYLITGGLSNIGLVFTEYIAQAVQARLVLLEDAAFPPRAQWQRWLAAHAEGDEVSRKIRTAQLLEDRGTELLVVGVDMAQADQLRQVLADSIEWFGHLHGVIHAATAAPEVWGELIRTFDRASHERLFESRTHALRALDEALRDRTLDFCLVTSSLASVLGGIGTVAYTSASLLLDAFVSNHNTRSGIPWVGVNWDVVRPQHQSAQRVAAGAQRATQAITSEQVAEILRRILATGGTTQIIISTGDLAQRIEQRAQHEALPGTAQSQPAAAPWVCHPRPELHNAYVVPSNPLERAIVDIWQRVLGIGQVGVTDNFFDLGGDSLLAIQIMAHLRSELNLDIPVASLYEGVTIRALAGLIQADQAAVGQSRQPTDYAPERLERASQKKLYQQNQRARKKAAE